jgi:hypothetical protein
MPRNMDVLCMHCNRYMSRARERAHRKKQQAPLYSPPPRIPSRLRRVFDIEEPDEHETEAGGSNVISGTGMDDCELDAPAIQAVEDFICDKWSSNRTIGNSDDEEDSDCSVSIKDDDPFDLESFEGESGLSAWDQLGDGYEQDAAEICECMIRKSILFYH